PPRRRASAGRPARRARRRGRRRRPPRHGRAQATSPPWSGRRPGSRRAPRSARGHASESALEGDPRRNERVVAGAVTTRRPVDRVVAEPDPPAPEDPVDAAPGGRTAARRGPTTARGRGEAVGGE